MPQRVGECLLRHAIDRELTVTVQTRQSSCDLVPYPKPGPGAPNVLMVVLDDVGFAQLGCFGSGIATPHIDRLAAEGLRYNRFHVTSVCSATRAAARPWLQRRT